MDKAIIILLVILLIVVLVSNVETFTGVSSDNLAPATYRKNYVDDFDKAVLSPMDRIAVLRNKEPEPEFTKCSVSDCPDILKNKGFDCFKCSL